MDIEFHYYMTYLIAARAGYAPGEAATIAHACQLVDDNTDVWTVTGAPDETVSKSQFSQSMNAWRLLDTDSERHLFPVYMAFHFIPGDPARDSAWRKGGWMHLLNTTPNALFARILLKHALKTGNLHRIGIACHAYADTWAHQNFTGTWDPFNSKMGGTVFSIGHGEFGHDPDPPGLVWTDPRLVGHQQNVNNTERCLQAANHLFHHLWMDRPADRREADEMAALEGLRKHLTEDIGEPATGPQAVLDRESHYEDRAMKPHCGATAIPKYHEKEWLQAAVEVTSPGEGKWREPKSYRETDWYQFQDAVKKHYLLAWSLFSADIEDRMDLKTPQSD